MGFLQTAFLLGLLACAIPIALHLFSRWQFERVELGTTRFLREVLNESSHRRRLRRWLLLLMRVAIVGCLAILFARPFFRETEKQKGDRHRVILIDASASMLSRVGGARAIDRAIEAANQSASEAGGRATIHWAWFHRSVQHFVPKTTRISVQDLPTATEMGATNYTHPIAWANERLQSIAKGVCDIVVVSDMQRCGLSELLSEDVSSTSTKPGEKEIGKEVKGSLFPVALVDVGRPASSNLAITRLEVRGAQPIDKRGESESLESAVKGRSKSLDRVIRPDQVIKVTVSLFNYGPLMREDVPVVVTATRGSLTTKSRATLNVRPEQAAELTIELGRLDIGIWSIAVDLDIEDDLSVDNRRWAAAEVGETPQVLVIDDTQKEAMAVPYLALALRGSMQSHEMRFNTRLCTSKDVAAEIDRERWSMVALGHCTEMGPMAIRVLESYVSSGGRLMVFAGEAFSGNAWKESALLPGTIGGVRSAGVVPYRLRPTRTEHPMLRPFADPQNGNLERLAFRKIFSLEGVSDSSVLAEFEAGQPAIVEHVNGKGRVVWFLSDSGDTWSNWCSSPLYLPVVQQMASYLAGLTGEGRVRERALGDPEEHEATTRLVGRFSPEDPKSEPSSVVATFNKCGVMPVGDAVYVVNVPTRESDLDRVPEPEMRQALGLESARQEVSETSPVSSSLRTEELWHWFAALLFFLFVTEFALANRTPA